MGACELGEKLLVRFCAGENSREVVLDFLRGFAGWHIFLHQRFADIDAELCEWILDIGGEGRM